MTAWEMAETQPICKAQLKYTNIVFDRVSVVYLVYQVKKWSSALKAQIRVTVASYPYTTGVGI